MKWEPAKSLQVIAYGILVIAIVLAFALLQHNNDRVNDLARANRRTLVQTNQQFCEVSRQRWVTTHLVIQTVTEHVMAPADADKATLERVQLRNEQLDDERARLFASLGPEPAPC